MDLILLACTSSVTVHITTGAECVITLAIYAKNESYRQRMCKYDALFWVQQKLEAMQCLLIDE